MARARSTTISTAPAPTTPASALAPSAALAPPAPPDLFILVRPPPSLGAHPLNLQVQLLVPSSSRGPQGGRGGGGGGSRPSSMYSSTSAGTGEASFGAVAGASVSRDGSVGAEGVEPATEGGEAGTVTGEGLTRSPSMSSTRSARSSRSGTSLGGMSIGTGTSETGEGGGRARRKVTPLLNLAFHSVLPTVVTDAGTDQRVAKFLKRGVELSGLAVFDPVTFASFAAPPSSSMSTSASTSTLPPPAPSPVQSSFLGKFKKLGFSSPTPSASAASSSKASTAESPSKFLSSLSASSSLDTPTPGALPLIRTPSNDLLSSTSGAVASATPADDKQGYVFVPRRWLRDDLAGTGDAGAAPRGVNGGFRLEWVKPARGSPGAGAKVMSRKSREGKRPSMDAKRSGSSGEQAGAEEDEDSDPEDSDRPWVCTLVYPLSASSASTAVGGAGRGLAPPDADPPRASMSSARSRSTAGGGREPSPSPPLSSTTASPPLTATASPSDAPAPRLRRLQLATLRPAPHHPKLISTLLLPPSLPSISLGSFSPARGLVGGSLSADELRDLAMVSALWVAVREGLGGLGGQEGVREEAGRTSLGVKIGGVGAGGGKKGIRGLFGGGGK
ncbi:hypothetical protein JCM10207_004396 [Rhodosporidiobolus poonsookiae]